MIGTTYYKYDIKSVKLLTRTEYGYTLKEIFVDGRETTRELFLHEAVAMLEQQSGWKLKVLD